MKGWIESIPGNTWDSLKVLPCEEWLWIDTAGAGVHLTTSLGNEPAQVTHVWGWGPHVAVRARIDPDLPHATGETGAAGAVLRLDDDTPADAMTVEVSVSEHPVWSPSDGRANLARISGLRDDEDRPVLLQALTCHLTTPDGVGEQRNVTFLRR